MKNELQLFIPGAKITNCVPVLLFHSPEKKGNLLISLLAMGGNMFLLSEKSIITLGLQRYSSFSDQFKYFIYKIYFQTKFLTCKYLCTRTYLLNCAASTAMMFS